MPKNVIFSLGNIALIEKIDSETDFFESVLGKIGGRSRSFIPSAKLLISNKLNQSVSINKLLDFTPDEQLEIFGFDDRISLGVCIESWSDSVRTDPLSLKDSSIGFSSRISLIQLSSWT